MRSNTINIPELVSISILLVLDNSHVRSINASFNFKNHFWLFIFNVETLLWLLFLLRLLFSFTSFLSAYFPFLITFLMFLKPDHSFINLQALMPDIKHAFLLMDTFKNVMIINFSHSEMLGTLIFILCTNNIKSFILFGLMGH